MKYVCDRCERLVPLTQFQVEDGALKATCPACGEESTTAPAAPPAPAFQRLVSAPGASNVVTLRPSTSEVVAAAAAAADEDPFAAPSGFCPRCVSVRSEAALACPACGLLFSNASHIGRPVGWLVADWKSLLRTWGDERAHSRLRTRAVEEGSLADVGRLYRVRLAARPDDSIAAHGRDEVLRLALLPTPSIAAVSPDDTPNSRRWQLLFAGLFVLFGILAVGWMARRMLNPE